MNRRHQLAQQNPLTRADGDPAVLLQLRQDRRHGTGMLIRTILAVDR